MSATDFTPPRPGAWQLDASHMPLPASRWLADVMPEPYTRGFKESFAAYGAMLDRIDGAFIDGWFYWCPRPVGAPETASGTPPKLVFKVMTYLHPEIRRRLRRSREAIDERLWRKEAKQFREEWRPEVLERHKALQAVDPTALDDAELSRHLDDCRDAYAKCTFLHHRMVACTSFPVGDYLAQVGGWTGRTAPDLLQLLRGHSKASLGASEALNRVAAAVAEEDELRAAVEADRDHETVLTRLTDAPGEVGQAARAWLDLVGNRIFSGFDIADLRACEAPAMLVRSLASALGGSSEEERADEALEAKIRDEVPAEHRDAFDELLEEARLVYGIRDERNDGVDDWAAGLTRRAVLEAGRRLAERARLKHVEHAVDLTPKELSSLLTKGEGPSADQVATWVQRRRSAKPGDAPASIGLEPSPPPPPEWLPGAGARVARAVGAYIGGMFDEREEPAPDETTLVKGLAASPGKRVGRARLVLSAADFAKVETGDVLVARMTAPAYNVLLPLLAGVVTDRGGLLSHPAIVTREYGIPGVVGTKCATARIPDGARVEIDGDAGTVKVLS